MGTTSPQESANGAGRVLIVIESTIGGTRLNLRSTALDLAGRGASVAIAYSARREKAFLEDVALFKSRGIECFEVPMRRAIAPFSDLRAVFALRRIIRAFRPDEIHLISSKAGFVGRLASIGLGVHVAYAPHCFAFKSDSLFRLLYALAERMLAPLTDTLVAVCESEAADARSIGYPESKIRVVRNTLPPGPGAKRARKRRARPLVVFAGRYSRQKGVDILLGAYRLLGGGKGCSFDLTVMSDLPPRVRRRFEALGAKTLPYGSRGDVMALLESGDILVMPSRWEAYPYLVLEALEAGLFIVASDVGGVGECVRDGETGILFSPNTPSALASALRSSL